MKGLALLSAFLAAAPGVLAQNATFIAEEIAQISPCGLSCLEYTIPQVGCSFVNTTCQCASTRLVQITSTCMFANCTLPETLALNKIQAAICQRPNESQNRKIRIMTIVCAVITNLAALLRFATRFGLQHAFGSDDWFIGAAVVSEAIFTYFGVQLERDGFGSHVWDIQLNDIPQLFYWFYICELLYVITIGLVKISILFFYLRVFVKYQFRVACWSTMGFVAASTLTYTLVTAFQCHPIIYVWRKDLKGKCVNYNSVAWSNAAINIFQDIIIILLPMNELRHLQLSRKKKIGMYAMFGVGGFVCVTSIVRLYSLRTFGLTADPTWDNIPTTFWSTLETSTAIFCACMPAIRAGFVRLFPTLRGGTTHLASSNRNISSRAPEKESTPCRVVDTKPRPKHIALMPLGMHATRSSRDLKMEGGGHADVGSGFPDGTDQHSRKHSTLPGIGIASTSTLSGQEKPLPVTPASTITISRSPTRDSISTNGEEMRDMGGFPAHHGLSISSLV